MKELSLVCTSCGRTWSADSAVFRCPVCEEPMEVAEITGRINSALRRPFERYADFYPESLRAHMRSLGEGCTSLVELKTLGEKLGIVLRVKNESQNPTWSFKDRGTLTAAAHAKSLGFDRIGTVSTGNMAVSTAAYGAAMDLKTLVLVAEGLPEEKIAPILAYGPRMIQVKGDYGSLYDESLALGRDKNIYFMNSDAPFRVEGYKTAAYEIFEQAGPKMPDWIVVPVSSGGNIRGIEKGFRELKRAGYIEKIPFFVCAQAAGCAPIHRAFSEKETLRRFEHPSTVAKAIANPWPPSGKAVLGMLGRNGGCTEAVTDMEILNAQEMLLNNGLFVQPASAVSLAACIKLRRSGKLPEGDSVVCLLTGSGLKAMSALKFKKKQAESCLMEDLAHMV